MEISNSSTEKLEEIYSTYVAQSKNVLFTEAMSKNPYNVGDIIEDHYQIGQIEKVLVSINLHRRNYKVSYKCRRLTKKLKPYKSKRAEECIIYGCNIERQIAV